MHKKIVMRDTQIIQRLLFVLEPLLKYAFLVAGDFENILGNV